MVGLSGFLLVYFPAKYWTSSQLAAMSYIGTLSHEEEVSFSVNRFFL